MCISIQLAIILSFRVGQKVPSDASEKAQAYFEVLSKMLSQNKFRVVANMDESPMWMDVPAGSTIDFRGLYSINIDHKNKWQQLNKTNV